MKTRTVIGVLSLAVYVGVIVAANYAVNRFGIVSVGFGLLAPAAVYFVGVAFTARDVIQETLGRYAVVLAIIAGAVLSYFVSSGRLALASGVAFLVSETADWLVYTPLREKDWLAAVTGSNIIGAAVDSLIFLWIAFHSLAFFWGQLVGKLWMTAAAIIVLALVRSKYQRVVISHG